MKNLKRAYKMNICIFLLELFSVLWMFSGLRLPGTGDALTAERMAMFKFFTIDSNILMGIISLIVAIQQKRVLSEKVKELHKGYTVLALMGTVGVTLTMIVTVFYLAPTFENGWFVCFNNSNFFLHLINPLASILAFTMFEKSTKLKFKDTLWGLLPLCLYAIFYVSNAAVHSENGIVNPGYDFYGFFIFGLKSGFIVLPLIILITFGLSVCLYRLNHIKYQRNALVATDEAFIDILQSQQGEIDAVLMYQQLARRCEDAEIKELLLQTASDEGGHGSVFHKLSGIELKPKKTKARLVPFLGKIIGAPKLYRIIAKQEYAAENGYEFLAKHYESVRDVQKEEKIHGDRMTKISDKLQKRK